MAGCANYILSLVLLFVLRKQFLPTSKFAQFVNKNFSILLVSMFMIVSLECQLYEFEMFFEESSMHLKGKYFRKKKL